MDLWILNQIPKSFSFIKMDANLKFINIGFFWPLFENVPRLTASLHICKSYMTLCQFSDSPVPMSQRNLPDSFWNSDYYQQLSQHSSLLSSSHGSQHHQHQQYDPYDAYVSAAADPWHNYMYHQHHRASADMYSQASRQYSSLLHLQSSAIARQAHQQGRQVAAALGKAPNDSWAAAAAVGSAAVDTFSSAAAATSHPHYSAAMTGMLFNL